MAQSFISTAVNKIKKVASSLGKSYQDLKQSPYGQLGQNLQRITTSVPQQLGKFAVNQANLSPQGMKQATNISQIFNKSLQGQATPQEKIALNKNYLEEGFGVAMGLMGGGGGKVNKAREINDTLKTLENRLRGLSGDITKPVSAIGIENFIQKSIREPLPTNPQLAEASKIARYVDLIRSGVMANKPPNVGLNIQNIRGKQKVAQGGLYDIKATKGGGGVVEGGASGITKEGKLLEETLAGKRQLIRPSENIIPQTYNAEPSLKTSAKIKARELKVEAQRANQEYKEWQSAVLKQEAPQATPKDIETIVKMKTVSPVGKDIEGYRDISGFQGQARDVYRNFKQVFGKKFEDVKRIVLDPFDKSKGNFIKSLDNHANELETNIVKKYGFNKGSKESAAIQQYGEGTLNINQLVKQFGEKKAKNIVEADSWFRKQYDTILDEVNAVRAKIYPNDPLKIIPKRQDYYRHFREMKEGFAGLLNIFDTSANIQSSLAGASAFTKPKSKWLSFAQRRLGGESDVDAVGGFINYVKSAEYAKNIDPHISKFRALREELAQATDIGTPNAGKLNNFIEFLDSYANDLSGKTSAADRFIQTVMPGGRKTMSVINWLNNRVKANVILGNASSSLAQIMNVPQGIASAGPVSSTKGLGRTIAQIFKPNKVMGQSDFITERYGHGVFDRFEGGMIKNTKKFAAWMVQALDEVGTKYIWNSHYEKALAQGLKNPIKFADDLTREMVAGRGIGEVPLLQKSKVFQLVAPFQLEVGNLWHVLGGFAKEKSFGKIATFLLASYVFNRGIAQVRGSDVSLDPIQASIEAYKAFNEEENKGKGLLRAGGRLVGEVLSNIPLGQTAAAAYPEYGKKIGDAQLPTRKELFGKGDPTRFGSGLLIAKGLQDPLYKVLPEFGGQQLQRTIQGIKAVNQGYSESASGRVQYPIEQSPWNYLQSALFGKSSTPEARTYFNENRTPLGEVQSKYFKQSPDKAGTYSEIIQNRLVEKESNKAKEQVKATGKSSSTSDKIYYLSGDSVETIDIGKVNSMSDSTDYQKALKEKAAYDLIDNIMNNLPEDQQAQALNQLGISNEDAVYYNVARQDNDLKTIWINDEISKIDSKDRTQLLNYLVTQRKVVNGDMVLADGVLTDLYENGIISKTEQTMLKNLKIIDGKVKTKITGRGKKATLKKVSLPTTSKIKAPKIKTMAQLLPKSTKIRIKKYNFRNKL